MGQNGQHRYWHLCNHWGFRYKYVYVHPGAPIFCCMQHIKECSLVSWTLAWNLKKEADANINGKKN